MNTITPAQLATLRESKADLALVDVRTPAEYREVHADIARNIPLDRLDPVAFFKARGGRESEPVYLICQSGGRGGKACEKFVAAGFSNVVNVEGGTKAWVAASLPVVRGKKTMSLERQVRIAAGSLVLIGIVASLFYKPLLGLSAFVGAGLVFAGITDTCGMAMLLARMPWNRLGTSCKS